MEEQNKQPEQMTFSKELKCECCGYKPKPEDLGKRCPQCSGTYELFDKVDSRRPFAQDRRRHGGI